ncbi:MAG: hypothetical protein KAS88_02855 [Deltaproteobacteria bacterium]|nr:hypothetical protein [Deltaproteobacteria bacterium]
MKKPELKESQSRQVNTYVELWHASIVFLENGMANPKGSTYQYMASLIFAAFTLEAYLNHVGYLGKEKISSWEDFEKLSPRKKLNKILYKYNINQNKSERPFETIEKLFDFRNDLAHGKSVYMEKEELVSWKSQEESLLGRTVTLKTEWEKYCSEESAAEAREDVEKIMLLIDEEAGTPENPLFNSGLGFHSIEPAE